MARKKNSQADERKVARSPRRRWRVWVGALVILVVGTGVRWPFLFAPGQPIDTAWFYDWARRAGHEPIPLLHEAPADGVGARVNYPPGYLYVLSVLPWLHDRICRGPSWDASATAIWYIRAKRDCEQITTMIRRTGAGPYPISPEADRRCRANFALIGLDDDYAAAGLRTNNDLVRFMEEHVLARDLPAPEHASIFFFLKLPALLADVLLTILLIAVGARLATARVALLAGAVYYLNPMTFYDSAVWGQVDSIYTLLLCGCVIALAARWYATAWGLLVTGVFVKPQTVMVMPVVLAVVAADVLRKLAARDAKDAPSLRRLAMSSAIGAVIPALALSAPYWLRGMTSRLIGVYTHLADAYPFITLNAFNFWWFFSRREGSTRFGFPLPDSDVWWLGMTPKTIGLVLLGIAAVVVAAGVVRRRGDRAGIWLGALALAVGFFSLPTEIHERYGFAILPLAILCAVAVGWRYWVVAIVLSLVHFVNLVYVFPPPGGLTTLLGPIRELAAARPTGVVIAVVNLTALVAVIWDLWRRPRDVARAVRPVARGPRRP